MDDIQRVVKSFGDAAWRCKEGGLDGCEVIAASHLVGQFLSPYTNHRTDEFGGSLENRARFGMMVFDEIRNRVGDDFIVGMRMPVAKTVFCSMRAFKSRSFLRPRAPLISLT